MTDDHADGPDAQLALLPQLARARAQQARRSTKKSGQKSDQKSSPSPVDAAPERPVARVLVDVPLAHLDRLFDYLVPAKMHQQVTDGSRVRVWFAGQLVDGFVVERVERSEHQGRLAPLQRAVSPEPVLAPEIARLSGSVAARYAGTRSDVLRLAVPRRHAAAEKQPVAEPPGPPPLDDARARRVWGPYAGGAAFLRALAERANPRVVWSALPGPDWPEALAHAAATAAWAGRGALLCVPDHRDVERVDAALTDLLGRGQHVVLTADLGPAARYRAFLAVRRGAVRIVLGTRAAAFAPVHDLGLVMLWDDGDDLHAEPRAPYPHTREVLLLRAEEQGCAALVGGCARTVEGEYLLDTGWARPLAPERGTLRERAPRVSITGATDRELERDPAARTARMPRTAHDAIKAALERGPVLVQTPRRGYLSTLACDRCRAPARCPACTGPLWIPSAQTPPTCRWCATAQPAWTCTECGGHGLRAPALGETRTAEEIGRAFPGLPVRTSAGERVLATVRAEPALVVATPGAEPVADGGYACVVLLDSWLMLARPDLRVAEESLRRWLNAAALARPAAEGGTVIVVGDPATPALQALVRWDPAGFARREMEERRSAHLPPASRLATLTGAEPELADTLRLLDPPPGAEVLGPAPLPQTGRGTPGATPQARVVVRVPRGRGAALSRALVEMQALRSARKLPAVRVQVDPVGLE